METLATVYIIIGAIYALITVLTIWDKDFDDFVMQEAGFEMTNLQKALHVASCLFFWPMHFVMALKK